MPYSSLDTIYTVWKISGQTYRSDDTKVFVSEWYTYNYDSQNKLISYYFIRDGFLYYTELTKSSQFPGNPYSEQKLAEVKPHNGDLWLQTIGYYNPDSSQDYLSVKYLDEYQTPAGRFKDVYKLVSFRGTPGTEFSEIYYTKYFGHIGYSDYGDNTYMLLVNYMRINGREVGTYVKMDSVFKNPKKIKMNIPNPFGIKYK